MSAPDKKLWVVTFSTDVVVLAEDEGEAKQEAADAMRSGDAEAEVEAARQMSYMPGGWDLGCIPFGADGDETLEDLIAAGAAPEYTKARERLRGGR